MSVPKLVPCLLALLLLGLGVSPDEANDALERRVFDVGDFESPTLGEIAPTLGLPPPVNW